MSERSADVPERLADDVKPRAAGAAPSFGYARQLHAARDSTRD